MVYNTKNQSRIECCNFDKWKKIVSNYFSFKQLTKAAMYFCTNLYTNTRLTLSNPIFQPTAYSPALICFWAAKRLVDYL
jgi:hypothetical protein